MLLVTVFIITQKIHFQTLGQYSAYVLCIMEKTASKQCCERIMVPM